MAENNKKKTAMGKAGMAAAQDSYNAAKLIRQGNRELERQYNSKRIRRER